MITMLKVPSPSQCAQEAIGEICAPCESCSRCLPDIPTPCIDCFKIREDGIRDRLRLIIRETIEQCAMAAEDWATDRGVYGCDADTIEPDAICDGIAEEIRKLADERRALTN